MAVPNNILVNVQTYQKAELAWLLNSFCGIKLANKKFKNFNDMTANLGDTVTFDLPPRYIGYNGLVITQQQSAQRLQPLVCSQAQNIAAAYTDQQFIFNVKDYMERFGQAAMLELGSIIETDILKNIVSGVVINDPQNANFGLQQTNSGPYRFGGDGVTQINSFGQLAQFVANFKDFGAAKNKMFGILPEPNIPAIVSTGLQQFATNRNNTMANSWELGMFAGTEWYTSNLLPTHVSGDVGVNGTTLTLVSTNDPTGQNVTQLTFSGATANDVNAIFAGDMAQFQDGVAGQPNLRFLHFIGHSVSQQPVQFLITANAAASAGGNVTLSVYPPMVWAQNENQNLNHTLQAGMQVKLLPSHRAGLLSSGDQFYMAMPQLPDQEPFSTVNTMDKESGASIRHYWGVQFGMNNRSYVRDAIWGSTMAQDNQFRIVFPM
jgi:hypothetical protein